MPEIRCITCSNPVRKDDPDVAFIRMANQARYFHRYPRGCQDAEAGNKIDEETYLSLYMERKEKPGHE